MLTAQDKARIETAIAAVERQTNGEIVLLVTPASQFYGWVHLLWGLAGWVASSLVLLISYNITGVLLTPGQIVFWQLLAVNLAALVSFLPALKRLSVPSKNLKETVADKAFASFFHAEHDDRVTKKRRVFLFISLFERCVEMRGDSHLTQEVSPDYWALRAEELQAAMSSREWTVVLLRIIAQLGELIDESSPTSLPAEAVPANQLYN